MKMTKTIRYIGFCLIVVSLIMLFYLFSFTVNAKEKSDGATQYTVLRIQAGSSTFPQTDYDVLFSQNQIACESLQLKTEESVEEQIKQISTAINSLGSDHVILLALGRTCIPALSSASVDQRIAALVILAPEIEGPEEIQAFGTRQPDIPIAIFAVHSELSRILYERLSGEDSSMFPGLKDNGLMAPTVFISPDTSRYFSEWNLPLQEQISQSVLAFIPEVQIKVSEYIDTYVLGLKAEDPVNFRTTSAVSYVIKIFAVTFLAAGLLLFFASIPVPKKSTAESAPSGKAETDIAAGGNKGTDSVANPSENAVANPGADTCAAVPAGLVRKMFIANYLAAIVFSAAIMALYAFNVVAAPRLFAAWPIIFYAVYSVFVYQILPVTRIRHRVPAKRILFTLCLAVFFTASVFILRAMHVFSIKETFSGIHTFVAAVLFLLLLLFSWILLSTDYIFLKSGTKDTAGVRMQRSWYVQISLWIPYVFMSFYFVLSGRLIDLLNCVLLFLTLLAGVWIRYIFRCTGGTPWLAAAAFSFFYALFVFI